MITSMRGYTIFEVMIVLSVTVVIFFAAILTFNGRTQRTQFSQAMYDLQSKIQGWANQVSTGTFPGATTYSCVISSFGSSSGYRPVLNNTASTQSTNTPCLYLGKAIVAPGPPAPANTIYAYDVLGSRANLSDSSGQCTISPLATPSPQPAIAIEQACPEPAVDTTRASYRLVETYSLLTGVKILSAKYYPTSLTTSQYAEILEFYSSFQTATASSQAMTAYTVQGNYNYPPSGATGVNNNLLYCIELKKTPNSPNDNCAIPTLIRGYGWRLCLQDSNLSSQKAEITVLGSPTGITTKLDMASTCTA